MLKSIEELFPYFFRFIQRFLKFKKTSKFFICGDLSNTAISKANFRQPKQKFTSIVITCATQKQHNQIIKWYITVFQAPLKMDSVRLKQYF